MGLGKRFLIILVVIVLTTLAYWTFHQSNLLKSQGDKFLREGNSQQAITYYQKAQRAFPLRSLAAEIAGAQLVAKSNEDYEQITEFAELQPVPPVANLPTIKLGPSEIFVPVLMYHHIRINPRPSDPVWAALNVSPEQLDGQLAFLTGHNYHAVTLDQMADALAGKTTLPPNPIALSFDDGYRNFYDNAFPILKKYQMKAIEFVITQVVDSPPYLTWTEIDEMDKSGLIEFGAHTRTHPSLPYISAASIRDEIFGSKTDLEQHLKKRVDWFAYPYGSYNDAIVQTVKDAGYIGAASTIYGAVQSQKNLYLFPRIMVDGRFTLDNIAQRIR